MLRPPNRNTEDGASYPRPRCVCVCVSLSLSLSLSFILSLARALSLSLLYPMYADVNNSDDDVVAFLRPQQSRKCLHVGGLMKVEEGWTSRLGRPLHFRAVRFAASRMQIMEVVIARRL